MAVDAGNCPGVEILTCSENFKEKLKLWSREVIVLVREVEVQCTFSGSYTGASMVQGFLTFERVFWVPLRT